MAKFKLIVSDPTTGKCSVSEVEGPRAQALIGRSLGEVIDGSNLGIAQGKTTISGGCDKNGIPMRSDVHGGAKKYIVLSSGPGFRPHRHGERRRKLIRGKTITEDTYQINFTLLKEAGKTKEPPAPVQPEPAATPVVKVPKPTEKAPQREAKSRKPAKKGK